MLVIVFSAISKNMPREQSSGVICTLYFTCRSDFNDILGEVAGFRYLNATEETRTGDRRVCCQSCWVYLVDSVKRFLKLISCDDLFYCSCCSVEVEPIYTQRELE